MNVRYKDYIKSIENKQYIIPNFQREYVWTSDYVKKLIGSILFDLKIGAILVYKDKLGELPYLEFSDNKVKNDKSEREVEYVIDGQQRLTSLMIAFSEFYNDKKFTPKFKRKYFLTFKFDTKIFGIDTFEFRKLEIGKGDDYDDFCDNNIDYVHSSKEFPRYEGKLPPIPCELFDDFDKLRATLKIFVDTKVKYMIENSEEPLSSVAVEELYEKGESWQWAFMDYISTSMNNQMEKIVIDKNVVKAIKTYQIMNTTGQRLDTLDILASHYSVKDDSERLYDVIDRLFRSPIVLDEINRIDKYRLFEKTLKLHSENSDDTWNFYQYMIDPINEKKDISSKVIEQFIKVMKYLSLDVAKFNLDMYKQDNLMKMDGADIKRYMPQAIDAINWAGLFMQLRCGVSNANKINNFWLLFVLAIIKIEAGNLTDRDLDTLQAWFFLSRFTGRYRIDQNSRALMDIQGLLEHINNNQQYMVLDEMYNLLDFDALDNSDLTKKEVLKCESIMEYKEIVTQFIAEFGIRNGYSSRILKEKLGMEDEVFICTLTFPYTKNPGLSLEIDHIHPLEFGLPLNLNSTSKIRRDKTNPYNSPLNKAYLSRLENNFMSSKSYNEYYPYLTQSYLSRNFLDKYNSFDEALEKRYEAFFIGLKNEIQNLLRF
jgi:hypothetical protein